MAASDPTRWTVLISAELAESFAQIVADKRTEPVDGPPEIGIIEGELVAIAPANFVYWRVTGVTTADEGVELALESDAAQDLAPGASVPALEVLGAQQRHARGAKPLGGWDA